MVEVLVLLPFYNRPRMVRNALQSLVESEYGNWRLAFVDDGSREPGEPVALSVLGSLASRATFYRIEMTDSEKSKCGGSRHGSYLNRAIREHPSCDAAIILCDDDALHPSYLGNLSEYFEDNPDVNSCYSRVIVFDPLSEDYRSATSLDFHCNGVEGPICGTCRVDASQVAWRTVCNREMGAWFPELQARDLDAAFFGELYRKSGPMHRTPFISQYKGWHSKQLGNVGAESAWSGHDIDQGQGSA